MNCLQLRTKTQTSISRKICCIKSGFQILYAIEQFSSLFSKDKLKQGAHINQTDDPPSPHMSWDNRCAVRSQQPPRVVWSWHLKDSPRQEKALLYTGFPWSLTDGHAVLMSPSKGEMAIHGCHCPHDMADIYMLR